MSLLTQYQEIGIDIESHDSILIDYLSEQFENSQSLSFLPPAEAVEHQDIYNQFSEHPIGVLLPLLKSDADDLTITICVRGQFRRWIFILDGQNSLIPLTYALRHLTELLYEILYHFGNYDQLYSLLAKKDHLIEYSVLPYESKCWMLERARKLWLLSDGEQLSDKVKQQLQQVSLHLYPMENLDDWELYSSQLVPSIHCRLQSKQNHAKKWIRSLPEGNFTKPITQYFNQNSIKLEIYEDFDLRMLGCADTVLSLEITKAKGTNAKVFHTEHLSQMIHLESLKLLDVGLEDFSFLETLTELHYLDVRFHPNITNLAPFYYLEKVEKILITHEDPDKLCTNSNLNLDL